MGATAAFCRDCCLFVGATTMNLGDLVCMNREHWSEEEKKQPMELGLVVAVDVYPPIISFVDGQICETPSQSVVVRWADGKDSVYHHSDLKIIKNKKNS